jgi:hypothetical protein
MEGEDHRDDIIRPNMAISISYGQLEILATTGVDGHNW